MASKLGRLTIDVAADVASLRRDMSQAQRTVKTGVDGISKSAASARRALGTIGAGLISAVTINKIISATKTQEAAVKQLEQGLSSTGNVVGQSLEELTKKAAELQKATTFGDEDIISAQAKLVTFTNITKEQFDRTIEAALDLSTRMDQDLKSSVVQLGKALNDPVANLSALSRTGIQFTETQKDMVKQLVKTNRLADAQTIILEELERQFGGSARAARDTFGGALDSLGNAFGDLFEVTDGLDDARKQVESLTSLLQDPATVAGINALISGVITLTGWFLKMSAAGTSGLKSYAEQLAAITNGPASIKDAISDMGRLQDLGANLSNPNIKSRFERNDGLIRSMIGFASVDELKQYLMLIQTEIVAATVDIGNLQKIGQTGESVEPFLQSYVQLRQVIEQALEAKKKLAAPVSNGGDSGSGEKPAGGGLPTLVDEKAAKAMEASLKSVQSAIAAAQPPLKQYADQVAVIDSLLAGGKLSQGEYNNALAIYKQRLDDAMGVNEQWKKDLTDAASFAESAKTEIDKLNEELARARQLAKDGLISPDVLAKTEDRITASLEAAKKGTDEMSVLMEQAGRNIQDQIGGTIKDTLTGDFDGILDSWKNLIYEMGSQLLAANFAESFGINNLLKGGSSGGGIGGLFSGLKGLLSFDGGGFTGPGSRTGGLDGKGGFLMVGHPQETVLDHTKGQQIGGNIYNTINVNANTEREGRISGAAAAREFNRMTAAGRRFR